MRNLYFIILLNLNYTVFCQVYYPGIDDEIIDSNTQDSVTSIIEPIPYEITLTNTAKQDFEEQAKKNVKALEGYIHILTRQDGSVSIAQKNDAHKLALDLFIDDNRLFEVSSITDGGKVTENNITVSQYLNRVRNYNYDKVEIKYTNIYISENLRLVSENPIIYQGTISIIQHFKGHYNEGGGYYEDISNRNMIINVTEKSVFTGDGTENYFVVLLGDCAITQTYR